MDTAVPKKIIQDESGKQIEYVFLAKRDELTKNRQLTRWVEEHDILLYEFKGEIKAISNICRHFGGPVGFHQAKDEIFTCLWHNWQYSAKDGSCITQPRLPLRQYKLLIQAEEIYVSLLD
jgi:nitrite reductase/ring-hydroxylating ferredoxin subunit